MADLLTSTITPWRFDSCDARRKRTGARPLQVRSSVARCSSVTPTETPAANRVSQRLRHSVERVVLVAAGGACSDVVKTLVDGRLEFEVLDDMSEVNQDPSGTPPLIVLVVEEATSEGLKQVERVLAGVERSLVVLVCDRIGRWEVRAALAAGVGGVVARADAGTALVPCIQAVQAGQVSVPLLHARQVDPPPLSSREKQILGLVVMGYMNSQIASQLCLAESTVKSHLSSAFGKLGVRSRNEAVRLILDRETGLGVGILELGGAPLI